VKKFTVPYSKSGTSALIIGSTLKGIATTPAAPCPALIANFWYIQQIKNRTTEQALENIH